MARDEHHTDAVQDTQGAHFIRRLRESIAYIPVHQGRTFVLYLDGALMLDEALASVVGDVVLLNRLGVRMVVVTGAHLEVDQALTAAGTPAAALEGDRRATSGAAMACIQAVVGSQRMRLESLACTRPGRINKPGCPADVRIASGNHVIGRPLGIIDGVDYGHAGCVRRIQSDYIHAHLAAGTLVHLGCIGYAMTGELFNLSAVHLAAQVAIDIRADKLILLSKTPLMQDGGERLSELNPSELEVFLKAAQLTPTDLGYHHISAILQAVRAGVPRTHLLNYEQEGTLLGELFSLEGTGTQIAMQRSEKIRPADAEDISGILALIEPLEREGVLVRREREWLEREISSFMVMDLDGLIIGCAALYPVVGTAMGEFACLVTHPEHQRQGMGEALLAAIEAKAPSAGINQLFTLTTQASHWFLEQGFEAGELSQLPAARQSLYNAQRHSKILLKTMPKCSDCS